MVESPCDSAPVPDGAALSAFQYFENVRNFLVAVQELGMPTFEASDLEQVCIMGSPLFPRTIDGIPFTVLMITFLNYQIQ